VRSANGTIRVFTFKDGLFARAAHDLRLRLEHFSVRLDGDELRVDFDLRSLVVEGAVESGVVTAYEPARRAEVEAVMHEHVLQTKRHPTARFTGSATARAEGFEVRGELELASPKTRPSLRPRGDSKR
jgi:hypothetical protein